MLINRWAWSDFDNFEGLAFSKPEDFTNMVTGSIFMLRRSDVNFIEHRPMEMIVKDTDRDSSRVVLYYGANLYVDNPGLQGKMLDKD